MLWLFSCAQSPHCPPGLHPDPARDRRLASLAGPLPPICYGTLEVSVTDGVTLLLDERHGDRALAARARHLATHQADGFPAPGPDCLAQAVRFEVAGWSQELQLRQELGLPAKYPFESDWRVHGEPAISRWLWTHPSGGEGVDALLDSYRQRCGE